MFKVTTDKDGKSYSDISDIGMEIRDSESGKTVPNMIFPAHMFGEKVGNFFLNFNGYDVVTKDRWQTRHYYRHFGQVGISRDPKTGKPLPNKIVRYEAKDKEVKEGKAKIGDIKNTYPPGHDPTTKLRDTPKPVDRIVMEKFAKAIVEKARKDNLFEDGSDYTKRNIQAILWYYEQGLYTDLGKQSIPLDYVQALATLNAKIKQ